MGNKSNDFSGNFQTGLHPFGNIPGDKTKRLGKPDGSVVYGSFRGSNNKMGEAAKIALNIAGLSAYIMGIFTNWNNFISILLGVVGLLYAVIKCAKEMEDYRYRKVERMEKEHHVNKLIKRKDETEG